MSFLLDSFKDFRLLSSVHIDVEQPKICVTFIVGTLGSGDEMLTSEMVGSAQYEVIRLLDNIRPGNMAGTWNLDKWLSNMTPADLCRDRL